MEVTELSRGQRGNRYWVTVRFVHTASGVESVHTFWSDSPIDAPTLSSLTDAKTTRLNLKRSLLNSFTLCSVESKEIIDKLIVAVRNQPALTKAQAISWYDNNYPDALWRGEQLLDAGRIWLRDELGYVPSWEQLKTYIINNTFEGIDG